MPPRHAPPHHSPLYPPLRSVLLSTPIIATQLRQLIKSPTPSLPKLYILINVERDLLPEIK